MQRANQIPFIVISAERPDADNKNRTHQLRMALDMAGLNYKACLGFFEGNHESSFAVFLDGRDRDHMSELDEARFVCDLAMHYGQDSVLFVGPSDGVHGRQAYLIHDADMTTVVHSYTLNVGEYLGHWKAIPMGERGNHDAYTLDLMDSEHAYVVA